MKVAVLGCGPAGLMAVHGVVSSFIDFGSGVESNRVRVFSKKRKSHLFGAQYLHKPIQGATPAAAITVDYRMQGNADDYRAKVYGDLWDGTVSPEDLAEPHAAWDIRATYDNLWQYYEHLIVDTLITPAVVRRIDEGGWDLIINTIPRDSLCYRGHTFGATEIIAAGDAPELGIDVGKSFPCPHDTVICNGEEYPSWYRMSNIFGHTTVEWPKNMRTAPPVLSAQLVRKPTYTDCDCWPQVVHMGRYGSWKKGVLSHEAYNEAYAMTYERMRNAAKQATR